MKPKRLLFPLLFLLFLFVIIPIAPIEADGPSPDPLRQPRPTSPYGMDLMGPGWQWTFPREDANPRLDGAIRVDLLDELFRKSWAAGVRRVRVAVWWCMTEPDRDQYEWEELDYVFQLAKNYGVDPVPEIYYTPDWAAIGSNIDIQCVSTDYPRNLPPSNMEDWSDFMAEFVKRYGAYGKDQIHDWEIWNEPDLYEFWYIPWNPAGANVDMYALMVKRARAEIDKYDVNGRLLLGGFSDIYGPDFLRRLMALRGPYDIREDVDIVTFHVFSDHANKISKLKSALGDNDFELWVTELNQNSWNETVSGQELANLYKLIAKEGITTSFWFKSWTSDWGPGIFAPPDPLWEAESFQINVFYNTFKQQAFPHALPDAPMLLQPSDAAIQGSRPMFAWKRPAAGTFPIAGYKLQVDNSLYRGEPYFHSPELDVWVPASLTHFLPLQMSNGQAGFAHSMPSSSPASPPSTPTMSYRPTQSLPPGQYYWRVAAVDVEGNVGPYSPVRALTVVGDERVFLPAIRH